MEQNAFPQWQASYAAHRIATFPIRFVDGQKRPAITNYQRIGLRASGQLAEKFGDADMLGFICGARNKITVLDCDSTDEKVLSDALTRHGATPLIVRTASGKFHGYYRHNNERRRIRPWRDRAIDILGGGVAVLPPSRIATRSYQIIAGSLDDLDRLPVMRGLDETFYARADPAPKRITIDSDNVTHGRRNNELFSHCMRHASHCTDFNVLLAQAESFNVHCTPPLDTDEVIHVATNAWSYTHQGRNRFGQTGAWFPTDECNALTAPDRHDALVLLTFLRGQNGPDAEFMIANGLAETLGWQRKRLAATRRLLIELGYISEVRAASSYRGAALYQWKLQTDGRSRFREGGQK
jgi:hypothetical protein